MQKQQVEKPQKQFSALLCQLNPFHKNAKNTIDRCQRSLKKYTNKSGIDIVMFPQMSFVGYNFKNQQDAQPYGNFQMQGEQFQFAIELAKKLYAYVGFGYIQKAKGFKKAKKTKPQQKEQNENQSNQIKEQNQENKQNKTSQQQTTVLYNSVAIIDRNGKLLCNYRKSHLFYNDQLWAEQGDGFITIQLKNCNGIPFKCTPLICMDINPKNFTSGQFQAADFILKNNVQVMLMFTNWVDSQKLDIQASDVKATYNYWLHRLTPLYKKSDKQRLLLFCDRCGCQDDVFANKKIRFYGSSCAIMMNPIYIIKNLDIENQGYLLIETKLPK